MHVDHELVEFVPVDEQEYEEVIEEYEEEILVQEGAPLHNPYFNDHWIYICNVYLSYRHFMKTICINISTHESY